MGVDKVRLESDVGLAALQDGAQTDHDRAQMLLGNRGSDGAGRGAGDEGWFAGPGILATGPRAPIDRVLQHGRNGAIMLRRNDQDAVGGDKLALEADDFGRQVALEILVEHRQIVDADQVSVEFVGAQLGERLRKLAVDGFAAIAADDDGDFRLRHGGPLVSFHLLTLNKCRTEPIGKRNRVTRTESCYVTHSRSLPAFASTADKRW